MLWLIPARSGSKRLPGKNKRLFCGLPLWLWSFATATRCMGDTDRIIVSTDDDDILRIVEAIGPFGSRRPDHLCGDDATSQSLIDYTFEQYPAENAVVLLQPTSPCRRDGAVHRLIAHGGQVRSVHEKTGEPDGNVYVYRRGETGWTGIPLIISHGDIDDLSQFNEEERKQMLWAFQ